MEGKTDNELIAEFMGLPLTKKSRTFSGTGHDVEIPFMTWRYNQSWDWLMPVVEKIDGMGYHVTIMRTRTIIAITLNVQNHIQSIHPGYSMIEVCYQAVVEFIKWYNRQKEKSNQHPDNKLSNDSADNKGNNEVPPS